MYHLCFNWVFNLYFPKCNYWMLIWLLFRCCYHQPSRCCNLYCLRLNHHSFNLFFNWSRNLYSWIFFDRNWNRLYLMYCYRSCYLYRCSCHRRFLFNWVLRPNCWILYSLCWRSECLYCRYFWIRHWMLYRLLPFCRKLFHLCLQRLSLFVLHRHHHL